VKICHVIGLLLVSSLVGCQPVADPSSLQLYAAALRDAAIVEPGEAHPLRPLTGDSATVLSLADAIWARSLTSGQTITLTCDLWVTVEPEVKRRCQRSQVKEIGRAHV
jgi:hypothetical protein